jgi:hypothetical protein
MAHILFTSRIIPLTLLSVHLLPESRHALGLAVVKASRLRLAYGVHGLRDYEQIIMVNVEHL